MTVSACSCSRIICLVLGGKNAAMNSVHAQASENTGLWIVYGSRVEVACIVNVGDALTSPLEFKRRSKVCCVECCLVSGLKMVVSVC